MAITITLLHGSLDQAACKQPVVQTKQAIQKLLLFYKGMNNATIYIGYMCAYLNT